MQFLIEFVSNVIGLLLYTIIIFNRFYTISGANLSNNTRGKYILYFPIKNKCPLCIRGMCNALCIKHLILMGEYKIYF